MDSKYLTLGGPGQHNVTFFYVSDIVDLIMKGIEEAHQVKIKKLEDLAQVKIKKLKHHDTENRDVIEVANRKEIKKNKVQELNRFQEQYRKFRLILGPLEIVNPKKPSETKTISLGDLPISTTYFREWISEQMDERKSAVFTLTAFLDSFFNDFINEALNTDACFNGQLVQKTHIFKSAITAYKTKSTDRDSVSKEISLRFARRLDMSKVKDQPLIQVAGDKYFPGGRPSTDPVAREVHYLMFYAGRTQPDALADKDSTKQKAEDEKVGVFHYGIAQDKGIVKTINFNRQSVPSLQMVRFEQEGYHGLSQLREQYDANIKTFANIQAQPGTYLYIEPQTFSPGTVDDLTQLGVGGYFMIIKSEHDFGPGTAESTITAKWVHGKYDRTSLTKNAVSTTAAESSTISKGKCKITQ